MIIVKENSPIKNALDLKGKTIGVQNGTTGQAAVGKLLGKENKTLKNSKTRLWRLWTYLTAASRRSLRTTQWQASM